MSIRRKLSVYLALFLGPFALLCQTPGPPHYRLYGGATYFSDSFNGVPGARSSMLGWDSAAEFPAWHNVRFKIDISGTTGQNGPASQKSMIFLGGAQYEHAFGKERAFAHALVGDVGIGRNWGPNGAAGMTASFAELLGAGIDTPLSRHFAWRIEGDLQHTNLALVQPGNHAIPEQLPGLPRFMGRISTGMVWTPRLHPASHESHSQRQPPETDLVAEAESSVGHWRIFAATWFSYFHVAGVEYDRSAWGRFLNARLDYVAEILPVVILEQPSKVLWSGHPLTTAHTTNPGLGISPIGVRFLWRAGERVQPYLIGKGGVIAFTSKALTPTASYENFSMQIMAGLQVRLSGPWEMRAGISDFHFSNGFIVPNDPGIDEIMYGGSLVYRMNSRRGSRAH